jgi:hypothetical protein
MKTKSTFFSLLMALAIAILFVSGQRANLKLVNNPSTKIQPPLEHQMEIENNMLYSAMPGVR